jgi:DnaJ-class molecular chaperone
MGKIIPNTPKKPKVVPCPKCNGSGKIGKETCSKCKGKGTVEILED